MGKVGSATCLTDDGNRKSPAVLPVSVGICEEIPRITVVLSYLHRR